MNKSAVLTVRLTPRHLADLKAAAVAEGRSVSGLIQHVVSAWLDARAAPPTADEA